MGLVDVALREPQSSILNKQTQVNPWDSDLVVKPSPLSITEVWFLKNCTGNLASCSSLLWGQNWSLPSNIRSVSWGPVPSGKPLVVCSYPLSFCPLPRNSGQRTWALLSHSCTQGATGPTWFLSGWPIPQGSNKASSVKTLFEKVLLFFSFKVNADISVRYGFKKYLRTQTLRTEIAFEVNWLIRLTNIEILSSKPHP